MKQQYGSAGTSINKTMVPAIFGAVDWKPNTKNLDIGGGRYDTATEFLSTKGVQNAIYDPYNRPQEHNDAILNGHRTYDSVTVSNVLNVIKEEEVRLAVIRMAFNFSRNGAIAHFYIYEGNKRGIGKESKPGCWQENRKTTTYITEIESVFGKGSVKRKGQHLMAKKGL